MDYSPGSYVKVLDSSVGVPEGWVRPSPKDQNFKYRVFNRGRVALVEGGQLLPAPEPVHMCSVNLDCPICGKERFW